MKLATMFLACIISLAAFSQEEKSICCKAFDEGCWTLIGANNGVEFYVTYKSIFLPGKYRITAYSKVVNTNQYDVISYTDVSASFYYQSSSSDTFLLKSIPIDKILDGRQTIVRQVDFFSNRKEIIISQIKPFRFEPKPAYK